MSLSLPRNPALALFVVLTGLASSCVERDRASSPSTGGGDDSTPMSTRHARMTNNPLVWNLQQRLTPSTPREDAEFGHGVGLDGGNAVVGAYREPDGPLDDVGAAYVFARTNGNWAQQQKLTAPTTEEWLRFGADVSIDGRTAIVGAPVDHNASYSTRESVHVFKRVAGSWTHQQRIVPQGVRNSGFGGNLEVEGTTVAVGAGADDPNGVTDAGAVHVYTRHNGFWSKQQVLAASNGAADDHLGSDVALDADTIVASAPFADHGGLNNPGAAYVFTRTKSTWSQQQKLTASDAADQDQFGDAVAVDKDTLLVGVPLDDPNGMSAAGSTYVFSRQNGTWSEQQILRASDADKSDFFGSDVAIDGAEKANWGGRLSRRSVRIRTDERHLARDQKTRPARPARQ